MSKTLWFDMDGTIADLYGVEGWLPMLIAEDPTPYKQARPLVNMNQLAHKLNKLQRAGYKLGIISWLSKSSTPEYDEAVTAAKLWWLKKHLHSVSWDAINIVSYGINKWSVCGEGVLFDDEAPNREAWQDEAYTPDNIFNILSGMERR